MRQSTNNEEEKRFKKKETWSPEVLLSSQMYARKYLLWTSYSLRKSKALFLKFPAGIPLPVSAYI